MTLLCGLLVLAALACGSLALAELLDKDPALLVLPVLAGSVIWLCLGGMAGLLLPAAWLWLAAMAGLTVFAALGAGMGLVYVLLTAAGVFVFEAVFSRIWMRFFQFGPLEWIWRMLTYGKRFPILRGRQQG